MGKVTFEALPPRGQTFDPVAGAIFGMEVASRPESLQVRMEGIRKLVLLDRREASPVTNSRYWSLILYRMNWAGLEVIPVRDTQPGNPRRGVLFVRFTKESRSKVREIIRTTEQEMLEERKNTVRQAVRRADAVRFEPDGSVVVRETGERQGIEEILQVLPSARPWTRAEYIITAAVAARRSRDAGAREHLRRVIDAIGLTGQGKAFDALLSGSAEDRRKAVETIFPEFTAREIDAVISSWETDA